MWWSCDQHYK